MRAFLPILAVLVASLFCLSCTIQAQTSQAQTSQTQTSRVLPGCETPPAIQKILDEQLGRKRLDPMKFAERIAFERQMLEDLIAKYPREVLPYQTLVNRMRNEDPDSYPALRDRLLKMARENPDDPLALMLAGWVLRDKNTAESIRLLEAAKAPNFPWPAKELAGDYFGGKAADQNKVRENIEMFFSICPASTDRYAQWLLSKDPALQPKVAVALRAQLEKETDPKRLEDYATLWGLEFRTHPPAQHDALRAQVARDLARLEKLHPRGDAEWQAFLIDGYKESGASKETLTARQDRLIREFPHASEAEDIVSDRWQKAHKEPDDQNDSVAWTRYKKEWEAAVKAWIGDYPDDAYLQRYLWFYAIADDDTIPEEEGVGALNKFLEAVTDYDSPSSRMWKYVNAGSTLVDRGWQPERALELMEEARKLAEADRLRSLDDDNLSDDQRKDRAEQEAWQRQYFDGVTLRAAKQAGKPEAASQLKASIETAPPADRKFQSGYWLNRARFEALQEHKQDALAYYQLALQTRVEPPKVRRGKLRDDLTDEARALWKSQGGTEAAWPVWSKPVSGGTEQASEGFWEKPTKPLPTFELSDLSGKTWRLKELGGKTVLISVWATWCGPCEAELPHVQKFYEKVKDRSDIQVLTFDIDEDPGQVAPYLKDKGYTFPVLPAYSTVVSLLDGFAIPQNWVVDPQGNWRWKQIGYASESDADFEKDIQARFDSAKSSQ
jgi:thiol-disulfide isomerase/thioredoxin